MVIGAQFTFAAIVLKIGQDQNTQFTRKNHVGHAFMHNKLMSMLCAANRVREHTQTDGTGQDRTRPAF